MGKLIGVVGLAFLCAGLVVGEPSANAQALPTYKGSDGSRDINPPAGDRAPTAKESAKDRVDTAKKTAGRVKKATETTTDKAVGTGAKAETKPTDGPSAAKRPADPKLKNGPFPLPDNLPKNARFVHIELHEEVTLGMAAFVKRVVRSLKKDDILVVDIKTFGGRVDAALSIADALKGVRDDGGFALAFIHPRAISAGALISYACDIIVVTPDGLMGASMPVSGKGKAVGEKYNSMVRAQMGTLAELKGRHKELGLAMVDSDVEVDGLIDKGKLLTLDGPQALDWHVASFAAKDLDEVIAKLGYNKPDRTYTIKKMNWNWAERLAGWLSSSVIAGLLMTIGMLGLMIGLYTGGNPVPMILGGACLLLFFFGQHVVNLAGVEEMVIFALGVGLLVFEGVAPGHIIPGILGLLLVVGSLVMALINVDSVPLAVQWQQGWITGALGTVFGAILATTILMFATFKIMPDTKFGQKLIMDGAIDARANERADAENEGAVGLEGTAVTDLHPAGKVKVGLKRYDAVARTGHISAGDSIKVVGTRGFSVVVKKVDSEQAS